MSEHLRSENRNTLAGIASVIAFPYLWLGLFVALAWLYNIGFFGRNLGSFLVPGLLCLVFLTPVVPAALVKFVVRPIFSNLLGHELIAEPGCITGLVSVVLAGLATLYFLSRGIFDVAGLLLLGAPVVGALLAGGVTLLLRGGGIRLPQRRNKSGSPTDIRVTKPPNSALPDTRKPPALSRPDRLALPGSNSRPSAVPTPRRGEKRSAPPRPSRRSQPPSRRSAPPRRKP